jgi:uncharacterized membrane protein
LSGALVLEERLVMSLVAASPEAASPGVIATVIVGVLASTAFLAWMMWRAYKSAERAERDPRYLRRRFIRWGLFYVAVVAINILDVATGKQPNMMLLGLPVPVMIAWAFFRTATRVKIPPSSQ